MSEDTFVNCFYCDKRNHIAEHFWSEEKDAPVCSDCYALHEYEEERDGIFA